MRNRWWWLASGLGSVLFAVAATASTASGTAVHGFVTKGLLAPVCRTDVPCEGPAARVMVIFTRMDERESIVRAVTRSTGFYRLGISPGRYEISVRGTGLRRGRVSPRQVRVVGGTDSRLDLHIDTGIQ